MEIRVGQYVETERGRGHVLDIVEDMPYVCGTGIKGTGHVSSIPSQANEVSPISFGQLEEERQKDREARGLVEIETGDPGFRVWANPGDEAKQKARAEKALKEKPRKAKRKRPAPSNRNTFFSAPKSPPKAKPPKIPGPYKNDAAKMKALAWLAEKQCNSPYWRQIVSAGDLIGATNGYVLWAQRDWREREDGAYSTKDFTKMDLKPVPMMDILNDGKHADKMVNFPETENAKVLPSWRNLRKVLAVLGEFDSVEIGINGNGTFGFRLISREPDGNSNECEAGWFGSDSPMGETRALGEIERPRDLKATFEWLYRNGKKAVEVGVLNNCLHLIGGDARVVSTLVVGD